MPFVNPPTTAWDAFPATFTCTLSGLDTTVYPVIVVPPLDVGAFQLTVAWVLLGVALTLRGDSGDRSASRAKPCPHTLLGSGEPVGTALFFR